MSKLAQNVIFQNVTRNFEATCTTPVVPHYNTITLQYIFIAGHPSHPSPPPIPSYAVFTIKDNKNPLNQMVYTVYTHLLNL